MSNHNPWKTNWSNKHKYTEDTHSPQIDLNHSNDTPPNNYQNRYSHYTDTNLDDTKPLPDTSELNNNGYTHDTFHPQSFNSQSPYNSANNEPKDMIYDRDELLNKYTSDTPPHPNLSNIRLESPQNDTFIHHNSREPISLERFPANDDNNAQPWRSRRAEKLKTHTSEPTDNDTNPSQTQPMPIHTYKDSRFTRFAHEQHSHTHSQKSPHSHESIGNGNGNAVIRKGNNENSHTAMDGSEGSEWYYKDPSGQEQGPFEQIQMSQWFNDGYFPQDLPIRCNGNTPYIQLKDWFRQGMSAFLDGIPKHWPQTNDEVIIFTHTHTTPPSSDTHTHTTHNTAEENRTNKSSIPDSHTPFYENVNDTTRMASIHPRPCEDGTDIIIKPMASNGNNAINYYLDGNGGNGYDYNSDNTPPIQSSKQNRFVHGQINNHKLTYANNDSSLAATPPQNMNANGNHGYDNDEYNYTPSTNPREEVSDGEINLHSLAHSGHGLYRSSTDPTHYSHSNRKYDPFGGQDLFANGRRIYNNSQNLSKFNAETHTHAMEHGGMHRKYIASVDTNSNVSNSNSSQTSAKRDRKPPIRHKWAPHSFMDTNAQFSNNQTMHSKAGHDDDLQIETVVPTKPPHHSHRYQSSESMSNHDEVSVSNKSKKARKRRKHKKSKLSNAWNGSGNSHSQRTTVTVHSITNNNSNVSFNALVAEDEQRLLEIKRQQRTDMLRRQTESSAVQPSNVISHSNNSNNNESNVPNVWVQNNPNNVSTANTANPKLTMHMTANVTNQSQSKANNTKQSQSQSNKLWSSRAKSKTVNSKIMNSNAYSKPITNANANATANVSNHRKSSSQSKNRRNKSVKNSNNNTKHTRTHHKSGNNKPNRNIEAVNRVSAELQQWLRTEIKKLNSEVDTASVAHLLLTLDDETAKITAQHTFGNGTDVNTFIDSFLVHRSHDIQQMKHMKNSKGSNKMHSGHKKHKKNKKFRR